MIFMPHYRGMELIFKNFFHIVKGKRAPIKLAYTLHTKSIHLH